MIDGYHEIIESILQSSDGPVDLDLISTLAVNITLCTRPEDAVFLFRDKGQPEDLISLYAYFKSVENFRDFNLKENMFSLDQHDYKLKTITGLLENSPVIHKVIDRPLSESDVSNRIDRLEILHNISNTMEAQQLNDFLFDVFIKNPYLLSLRTYYLISLTAWGVISSPKERETYLFLIGLQQDLLNWRKNFSKEINLVEGFL